MHRKNNKSNILDPEALENVISRARNDSLPSGSPPPPPSYEQSLLPPLTQSSSSWIQCCEINSGKLIEYNEESKEVRYVTDSPSKRRQRTNVQTSLTIIGTHLDTLLSMAENLPGDAELSLREMEEQLSHVRRAMDEITADEEKDDVEVLVNFSECGWQFADSDDVDFFRARAGQVAHDIFAMKSTHMPTYSCSFPIPASQPGSVPVFFTVHLPMEAQQFVRFLKEPYCCDMSIRQLIQKVLDKFHKRMSPSDNTLGRDASMYVLKSVGANEYMDLDSPVLSCEYVTECIRNGLPVNLLLTTPPLPPSGDAHDESKERARLLRQKYLEQISAQTPVLSIGDYSNMATAMIDRDVFTLSDLVVGNAHSGMSLPFKIRVGGIDNLKASVIPFLPIGAQATGVYVYVYMIHGDTVLSGSPRRTRALPLNQNPRFCEWLEGKQGEKLLYDQIPRESRIVFLVCAPAASDKDQDNVVAYAILQYVDAVGRVRAGKLRVPLWPVVSESRKLTDVERRLFRVPPVLNRSTDPTTVLSVEFEEFALPVVAPFVEPVRQAALGGRVTEKVDIAKKDKLHCHTVSASDPLTKLSAEDAQYLWKYRHYFKHYPAALPKFLSVVNWGNVEERMEAYRMMIQWMHPQQIETAIELLDYRFADYRVREYAVSLLRELKDDRLQLVLLQLTQALKFEPYHDSPLVRFLIERSLQNPYQIGHYVFWHLKAEMASRNCCERFSLILEELLSFSGTLSQELRKQSKVVANLQRVAELIVKMKTEMKLTDQECTVRYRDELRKLNSLFTQLGSFQLPLNPKIEATTLIVDRCRFMSSKKVPLWLVFENKDATGDPIQVIFKSGDDLRQDILTLQMLKLMDRLWLDRGLDMRLKPYRCIATGVNDEGEGVGMIEAVLNSDTTSGIHIKYGGGAIGALRAETLHMFLEAHNKSENDMEMAVENFYRSCAGYCVATYVLGIGDRHNGNIMITKDGHLFHIDFGHFLGNFKKKFGFNRERAAFVFTPEMAFAIGGHKYKKSEKFNFFKVLCCEAFNCLRENFTLLELLFMLMVSAGMPELMEEEDIMYLRNMLQLDQSNKDAEKTFKKEMKKSLDTTWRRIDNLIHNAKHG